MSGNQNKAKRMSVDKDEPPAEGNTVRRQEVIDAVAAFFARHGFHGVGTRALADAVGIKVSSLYFHVKSKDHALAEVCHHGIDPPIDFVAQAQALDKPLDQKLKLYFELMYSQLLKEADYAIVFVSERKHLGGEERKQIDQKLKRFRKALLSLFESAAASGELHPDLTPRSASFIMIGTIRNLTQLYTEGPFTDFAQFFDDSVKALIRSVSNR